MLLRVRIVELQVISQGKEETIIVIRGMYINVRMAIDMMSLILFLAVLLAQEIIVRIVEPQLILQGKEEIIMAIGGMYTNVRMGIDIMFLTKNIN